KDRAKTATADSLKQLPKTTKITTLLTGLEIPMADMFKASLITPEAIVLETTVSAAQIPAFDGLLGILDKRAPLLAKLATGVLRLTTNAGVPRYLVSG